MNRLKELLFNIMRYRLLIALYLICFGFNLAWGVNWSSCFGCCGGGSSAQEEAPLQLNFRYNEQNQGNNFLMEWVHSTKDGDLILGLYENGHPSSIMEKMLHINDNETAPWLLEEHKTRRLLTTLQISHVENVEEYTKFHSFLSKSTKYGMLYGKSFGQISVNKLIPELDRAAIDYTLSKGNKLHFITDNVDLAAAFDEAHPSYNSLTSGEIRYIVDNELQGQVIWWRNFKVIPSPAEVENAALPVFWVSRNSLV